MGRGTLGSSRGMAASLSAAMPARAAASTRETAPSASTFSHRTFNADINSGDAASVQAVLRNAPSGSRIHITTNQDGHAHDIITATKQADGSWTRRQQIFTTTAESYFKPLSPVTSANLASQIHSSKQAGDNIEGRASRKGR